MKLKWNVDRRGVIYSSTENARYAIRIARNGAAWCHVQTRTGHVGTVTRSLKTGQEFCQRQEDDLRAAAKESDIWAQLEQGAA